MAGKTTTAPPKKRAAPVKRPETNARAEAVENILRNVEKKMSEKETKATLGDYIKLIQLSKEMTEEPNADITVTWIEK
jgi:hypothetical protein